MKTKTLSILFALVMVLSLSAGVFAEDAWNQTWDEETVMQYFADLDLLFPDLFADVDSDFLWTVSDSGSEAVIPDFAPKSVEDGLEEKTFVDNGNPMTVEATTDPCGDGLIKLDVEFAKMDAAGFYNGPDNTTYIRTINVTDDKNNPYEIVKCTSTGGDNCRSVDFNKKTGKAKMTIYVYGNAVYTADAAGENIVNAPTMKVSITSSAYQSAYFNPYEQKTPAEGTAVLKPSDKNYCQASLIEFEPSEYSTPKVTAVRAKYDQNTGEARFQAFVANKEGVKNATYNSYFAIPAEVIIVDTDGTMVQHIKDYTCKYTVYNNVNGAPRTDYCKYGEGIALAANALVRFDITVDHLSSDVLLKIGKVTEKNPANIPFVFRVGGMTEFVGLGGKSYDGNATVKVSGADKVVPAFVKVDYPCPIVSRMQVMDPLKPFMSFYSLDQILFDTPIEPSGAYGVYDGGLWGMYQKCGKYAYMAVRLNNDGIKDEVVDLNKVAVAINGGTPMSWNWVLTSVEADEDNTITLEAGQDVVLIGRAKVTDYGYQMNSDQAITGAVNFLDYGFYIQGKVYSDHNNTRCAVAP